jgi:hypothetical protein
LKLIDVDSYLNNDKTDYGDYPILGGRVNFKLGGVNVQYYAGKHEEIDYADLTSTAGIQQPTPPLFNLGGELFVGNPDLPAAVFPPPSAVQVIDQSQGARVSFGVPLKGTLGLTWLEGAGSVDSDRYRRLQVFGADLNATLFNRLRLYAEVAESEWKNRFGQETSIDDDNERRAWDIRAGWTFGKLDLTGYYKRLGVGFDAPGYWGTIGRWKNPRGLEGFGGKLTLPLGGRTSLIAEAADYRFIGLADTDLRHYKAGIAFALTSSNRVDLGYERAQYEPPGGLDDATEEYFNIGWGHTFNSTMSFKLLYQIINFDVGGTGINPLQDYDASVAVTQFTVRF